MTNSSLGVFLSYFMSLMVSSIGGLIKLGPLYTTYYNIMITTSQPRTSIIHVFWSHDIPIM